MHGYREGAQRQNDSSFLSEELVEVVWCTMRDQDQFPPDGRILGRVEESEHAEVSTNPLWPWNIVGSPRKRKGGRTLGINYIQWTRESKVWAKRWWARGAWPIFFLFFFFLHIYEFIISHLNAESIRIISCSSCPWLGQQGWSTLAALRLTHQQQHQPSGGGKTPAVAGCLPAISCGALCCDDREAMWRQLHRVLPPLPSAKSHQSPSPVWRTTEMLLAGLVFVPLTSQREAPLLTLITLRRLSTLLVGVDTMVLSVRVALGDFVEKKKKKKEEEVTTQLPK